MAQIVFTRTVSIPDCEAAVAAEWPVGCCSPASRLAGTGRERLMTGHQVVLQAQARLKWLLTSTACLAG